MLELFREYWERRALVGVMTRRYLIARYRGTALGFLWTFCHPLLLFAVYALVFGVFVRVPVERYPAFLLAGLLPWTWFAQGLALGASATLTDGTWIRQAAFSPAIPPLVVTLATLVNFACELPIVLAILLALGVTPSPWLALLPLVAALQLALGLGLALATSALAVRYRDTIQLLQAISPIWFFLTPVVYPLSQVPAPYARLLELNPVTHLVGAYQAILYRGEPPSLAALGAAALYGLLALVAGAAVLKRLRDRIPEEL